MCQVLRDHITRTTTLCVLFQTQGWEPSGIHSTMDLSSTDPEPHIYSNFPSHTYTLCFLFCQLEGL